MCQKRDQEYRHVLVSRDFFAHISSLIRSELLSAATMMSSERLGQIRHSIAFGLKLFGEIRGPLELLDEISITLGVFENIARCEAVGEMLRRHVEAHCKIVRDQIAKLREEAQRSMPAHSGIPNLSSVPMQREDAASENADRTAFPLADTLEQAA